MVVVPARKGKAHPRPELYFAHPSRQPFVWETQMKMAYVQVDTDEEILHPAHPQSFIGQTEEKIIKEKRGSTLRDNIRISTMQTIFRRFSRLGIRMVRPMLCIKYRQRLK